MSEPLVGEQFQSLQRQTDTQLFGMWVFLGSELLLFAGLFALYGAYRGTYRESFVDALHHNTLAYGTANMYVLLTSSFAIALAVHYLRAGRARVAAGLTFLGALLGVAFLVIKGFEYAEHIRERALPGPYYAYAECPTLGGNRFFTMYWVATGAHALHVLGGIGVLLWIGVRAVRGHYPAGYTTRFEVGTLYWHFVDVMWIILWPILYLA